MWVSAYLCKELFDLIEVGRPAMDVVVLPQQLGPGQEEKERGAQHKLLVHRA